MADHLAQYIDLYREHCGTTPTLNNQEAEVIRRLVEWARSNGPSQQGWISVDERLPEQGQEVLIYHILGDRGRCPKAYDVAWFYHDGWTFPWADRGDSAPVWVTHWMPLPAVPTATNRETP